MIFAGRDAQTSRPTYLKTTRGLDPLHGQTITAYHRLWVARTTPRDQTGEPDVKPGFANRYEAACWLVEISGIHNAETIYGRARAA